MIVGARAKRPTELAFRLSDGMLVDAGETSPHQPISREFSVLVTIGSDPVAAVVVIFIGVAYGDGIVGKGPQFLDQPVIEFFGPFAFQERLRLITSAREFHAVAPLRVLCIGQRHFCSVAAVPTVLCKTNFLAGCFGGEGWQRRTRYDGFP